MGSNRYGNYPLVVDNVNLLQCSRVRLSPGLSRRIIEMGGAVHTLYVAHDRQQVSVTFTTTELARVMDKLATPWQGFSIQSASPATLPLILYLQKRPDRATRSTENDFIRITFADGLLVPRQLRATDGGEAALDMEFFPIAPDGQTAPYAVSSAGSNPAIAQPLASLQVWTTGPAKINSALIQEDNYNHLMGLNVDFGIALDLAGGDGNFNNRYVGCDTAHPEIALAFGDGKVIPDVGMGGAVQGVHPSVVFLRKMARGAAHVSNATAAHCSLAMTAGTIEPTELSVDGVAAARTGLLLTPAHNGTDVQLAISTATAIT